MMTARFDPTNSRLANVRDSLAELHRALLDVERRDMELETGRLSPGAYLQMLLNDPRFAWLRPVGRMVATLDETMHESRKLGTAVADDEVEKLCDQVAGVLAIRTRLEAGYRYRDLMQRDPDVVMAHAAVVNALKSETAPIAA
ncbi:MAG TPA: hypothetical protein VJU15_00910 [Gemmatimonadales bacterium]|nr:hypothetical protein [Gemmatimonadales bacterium]